MIRPNNILGIIHHPQLNKERNLKQSFLSNGELVRAAFRCCYRDRFVIVIFVCRFQPRNRYSPYYNSIHLIDACCEFLLVYQENIR